MNTYKKEIICSWWDFIRDESDWDLIRTTFANLSTLLIANGQNPIDCVNLSAFITFKYEIEDNRTYYDENDYEVRISIGTAEHILKVEMCPSFISTEIEKLPQRDREDAYYDEIIDARHDG